MSKVTVLFEHSDSFILSEMKEGRSARKSEEKVVDLSELSSEERALLSEVVNVCGNSNRGIYFTFKGLYGIYRQGSNDIHEVLKAYAEGKAKSEELDRVREEEARKRKEEEESSREKESKTLEAFKLYIESIGSEFAGGTDGYCIVCKTATGSVTVRKDDIIRNMVDACDEVRKSVEESKAVASFISEHGSDYLKGLFGNGFEYAGQLYDEVREHYRPEGYDLPEDCTLDGYKYTGALSESTLNLFLEESKETESKGYGKPTLSCYEDGDVGTLYLKVSLETKELGKMAYGKVLLP